MSQGGSSQCKWCGDVSPIGSVWLQSSKFSPSSLHSPSLASSLCFLPASSSRWSITLAGSREALIGCWCWAPSPSPSSPPSLSPSSSHHHRHHHRHTIIATITRWRAPSPSWSHGSTWAPWPSSSSPSSPSWPSLPYLCSPLWGSTLDQRNRIHYAKLCPAF